VSLFVASLPLEGACRFPWATPLIVVSERLLVSGACCSTDDLLTSLLICHSSCSLSAVIYDSTANRCSWHGKDGGSDLASRNYAAPLVVRQRRHLHVQIGFTVPFGLEVLVICMRGLSLEKVVALVGHLSGTLQLALLLAVGTSRS